ncbi:hypothetical protein OQI_04485 [Streptomyces pharetrae CZA14]|uniref:Uncharacterized protein n=1 Tax=Streptomyces pharetrae CZA14 TaxID=1144883 RepID=A0ABX3YNP7_9ACTN|nr:hypothetical protein OQI_04485 [Streptomyces pharetrae CZA14]
MYTMNGREVIEFGSTGFFGSLLVDVSSGSILERVQDATNLSMVNTSLSAFNNCLEMFSEYFPLDQIDDEDASIERNARVAREIESDVKRIDPEAYEEGSFWYEVRWSVAIGDFED